MAGSGCIFRDMFGIYCPGCGGTRAVLALCRGDILASLYYHPLVLYFLAVFGLFFANRALAMFRVPGVHKMRFPEWTLFLAIIILVVNCIVHNVLKFGFGVTL